MNLAKLLMVAKVEFRKENKIITFESSKCQKWQNHFAHEELNEDQIYQRCFDVINKYVIIYKE